MQSGEGGAAELHEGLKSTTSSPECTVSTHSSHPLPRLVCRGAQRLAFPDEVRTCYMRRRLASQAGRQAGREN
jgi:hypothetical protein